MQRRIMKIQSLRIAAAVLVLLSVASAQDWAREELEKSPRRQDWVQIQHGNRTVDTFVVFPGGSAKAPVVLVLPDVQGMTEWVQNVADQFAAHGYIAMVPDFVSGLGPSGGGAFSFANHRFAQDATAKLTSDQVMADLNAVADLAKTLPAGNGKLAVAGFGWGGAQSFTFATRRSDLGAVFVFGGTAPMDSAELSKIKAPVYDFYGSRDDKVSATIPKTTEMMKQAGKTYEPVSYRGAAPDFMLTAEAPYPSTFDKEAHDQSWQRMLSVLKGM
jgi:carboxymethylenebutenolidase